MRIPACLLIYRVRNPPKNRGQKHSNISGTVPKLMDGWTAVANVKFTTPASPSKTPEMR